MRCSRCGGKAAESRRGGQTEAAGCSAESAPAEDHASGVRRKLVACTIAAKRCAYERAGVYVSAGTDDEPGDEKDAYSALDKELGLLVRSAGLAPQDALRSATVVGARTIGREKDMG
jgi:imidazolonepropionase-like amidohydrolase